MQTHKIFQEHLYFYLKHPLNQQLQVSLAVSHDEVSGLMGLADLLCNANSFKYSGSRLLSLSSRMKY